MVSLTESYMPEIVFADLVRDLSNCASAACSHPQFTSVPLSLVYA